MKIDMTRIFHPVGQGAFYTEEFHNGEVGCFRVVYDCGTKTSKNKVDTESVIKDAFDCDGQIDILFISHFDFDHVSLLGELIKHRSIKRVVLPLLQVEETAVLRAHYRQTGNFIGESLLADPDEFFNNETAVLHVEPTGNEPIELQPNHAEESRDITHDLDVVILKPNGERVETRNRGKKYIPSGARISVPLYSWCYIPHNYEYTERHQALVNELDKRRDIDKTRLCDASYIIEKSSELNKVYKSLGHVKCGNINENSMLVYSGPPRCSSGVTPGWRELICGSHELNCWFGDRPACIYSGDADFNKVKIHEVYTKLWTNVGTVQIPHHGSSGSFSAEFLGESDCAYLCPISTGRQHGHPASSVLKDILISHSFPLIVDECPSSKIIQHVWRG